MINNLSYQNDKTGIIITADNFDYKNKNGFIKIQLSRFGNIVISANDKYDEQELFEMIAYLSRDDVDDYRQEIIAAVYLSENNNADLYNFLVDSNKSKYYFSTEYISWNALGLAIIDKVYPEFKDRSIAKAFIDGLKTSKIVYYPLVKGKNFKKKGYYWEYNGTIYGCIEKDECKDDR